MKRFQKFYHRMSWRVLVFVAALGMATGVIATGIHRVQALSDCPCHIFQASDPSVAPTAYDDATQLEVGVKFKPRSDGTITGVRFYKDISMTDTHIGNLWAADGSLLASGTFSGESTTGWQDLTFATPVSVTADTTYVASYYTPSGKYVATSHFFDSAVDNFPLFAPDSTSVNGNGVFKVGHDLFPDQSFNAANYWVDVTFEEIPDATPPAVASTNPANGATGVVNGANLNVTFDRSLLSTTVSTATLKLTDSHGTDVPGAVSYASASKTAIFNPTAKLDDNATYVLSIRGGSSGVTTPNGVAMAADYQMSFTTGTDGCPCSVWNNGSLTNNPQTGNDGAVSLGVKMHASEDGYLQAVRVYKPLKSTMSSYTVHVWKLDGTLLGSGTSSHDTAQGWQEVALSSPVAVTDGTDYVVSYYSSDGFYVYSDGGLTAEAGGGTLRADAGGSRFTYNADLFPAIANGNSVNANYWIDALFTVEATYTAPLKVSATQPKADAYGVKTTDPITLNLTGAANTSTVAGSLVLKNAANQTISGTTTYNDELHLLSFTPTATLSSATEYTLTLSSSLKNLAGTAATPYTLHFTTGGPNLADISQGLGGPVLVLTSSADPYGTYLAEMLRTEGINYFTVKDISQISASTLGSYRMVVLAKSVLSTTQVTDLNAWVRAGGNLIAMQPDKKLAGLLGLTDQSNTQTEGYIKVDATTDPGTGITAETMQYHGVADIYTPKAGTKVVAKLFGDASTDTGYPSITEATAGSGHAAAFVYNLPKSIALTHQGNPAAQDQDRDGNPTIRPNDLFHGAGAEPDWLDLSKAHIPQADEQQRLLVNMILTMDKQHTPLPRFWILPHGYKAALEMTEDDHALATATYDIFNDMLTVSPSNCSVADWECARSGALIYPGSGLTQAQAYRSRAYGFSMGSHVNTNCTTLPTYSDLQTTYTNELNGFKARFPNLPPQNMDRTHCFAWPGWDWTAKVDAENGIRINYNYDYYPVEWTGSNTGYLTGSSLNMRFTDSAGALINTYQGVSDLDYETDPTSVSINADLDNSLNANAFYGVVGTHYDSSATDYYKRLMTGAISHGIPLISSEQLTNWKDGLQSSTFSSVTSSDSSLTFTASVGQGGEGAEAMVPSASGNGSITSLTRDGSTVAYTTSVVKGVSYAVFDGRPGTYTASYGSAPATQDTSGAASGGQTTAPAIDKATANAKTGTASAATPLAAAITNPDPFAGPASGASGQAKGSQAASAAPVTQLETGGRSGELNALSKVGYTAGSLAFASIMVKSIASLRQFVTRRRKALP